MPLRRNRMVRVRLAVVVGLFAWTVAAITFVAAPPAGATTTTFGATLLPANEVPPHATPASGQATVVLDDVAGTIKVDVSWLDLASPATAGHIHGPASPGTNAPVLFPFSGVPSVITGSIPEQTFAITPGQIAELQAGLYYVNIHDAVFPGGEVRGFLTPESAPAVPEAGWVIGLPLSAMLLAAIAVVWRRRQHHSGAGVAHAS